MIAYIFAGGPASPHKKKKKAGGACLVRCPLSNNADPEKAAALCPRIGWKKSLLSAFPFS